MEGSKDKRTVGAKQMFSPAASFLCMFFLFLFSPPACLESLQNMATIQGRLHVSAALTCQVRAGVHVNTAGAAALQACTDSCVSGRKGLQASVDGTVVWRIYPLGAPLLFPLTWLFFIFLHFLLFFPFTTHPFPSFFSLPLYLFIFFPCTACMMEPVAQLGIKHRTIVGTDVRCLKNPGSQGQRLAATHTWMYTHNQMIHAT